MFLICSLVLLAIIMGMFYVQVEYDRFEQNERRRFVARNRGLSHYSHLCANGEVCFRSTATPSYQ